MIQSINFISQVFDPKPCKKCATRNGNFDQIYQYTRLIIKHEVLIDQQDIYYIKKIYNFIKNVRMDFWYRSQAVLSILFYITNSQVVFTRDCKAFMYQLYSTYFTPFILINLIEKIQRDF